MKKDPNFAGYRAKLPDGKVGPREALRRLKRKVLFGPLLLPYGTYKHRHLLRTCDRVDNHTYTCFFRGPAQLRALSGPVLDFLGNPEKQGRRLEILSFACSNGAEVYTMASWLLSNVPGLDFRITASDLHQEMVERCEAADYSEGEALQSEYITTDFVDSTFDRQGERYVVKPNVRERVTFTQANLLDDQGLKERFGPADIVTAQNVLFHLKPPEAERAFNNVVGFLKERSVLMVEGMDLDLRSRCTTEHGLRPLGWDLKNIYSETRVHTPPDWWNYYWGTEPFTGWRSDKERRYATIFLKG